MLVGLTAGQRLARSPRPSRSRGPLSYRLTAEALTREQEQCRAIGTAKGAGEAAASGVDHVGDLAALSPRTRRCRWRRPPIPHRRRRGRCRLAPGPAGRQKSAGSTASRPRRCRTPRVARPSSRRRSACARRGSLPARWGTGASGQRPQPTRSAARARLPPPAAATAGCACRSRGCRHTRSTPIDDHVVARRRRQIREIGMLGQRAVSFEADDTPVGHRHDEHPAVGKPSESGRPPLDDANLLDRPVEIDRQDLLRPHIRDNQVAVMPPRSLDEPEPLREQRSFHARIIAGAAPPAPGRVAPVAPDQGVPAAVKVRRRTQLGE